LGKFFKIIQLSSDDSDHKGTFKYHMTLWGVAQTIKSAVKWGRGLAKSSL